MSPHTSFEVDISPDVESGQTLLVGLAKPGMAGFTAADYLVRQMESEEIGNVTPDTLPAITPVEGGKPRNHTRIYNLVDVDLTVIVGELFVPAWAARSFAETVLEWVESVQIEEIVFSTQFRTPTAPNSTHSSTWRQTTTAKCDSATRISSHWEVACSTVLPANW